MTPSELDELERQMRSWEESLSDLPAEVSSKDVLDLIALARIGAAAVELQQLYDRNAADPELNCGEKLVEVMCSAYLARKDG